MGKHKITAMRVHCVSIPARAVHSHGSGDVAGINIALCELTTDSGLTGWGEASPWPVFTGTLEGNAAALDKYFRPLVIGQDPVQVEPIMTAANRVLTDHNEAKAALETALLDLAGQIAGLSIAALLGGQHQSRIPLSFSVANPDFEANLDEVARACRDWGFFQVVNHGVDSALSDAALAVARPLGLSRYGPEQVRFLQYRPVLDNTALKTVFGYVPQKTSAEVFDLWKRSVGL